MKDAVKIVNLNSRPDDARRLAGAALIPLAACGLQWFFRAAIQPHAFLLFFPAVFFSSWIGGLRGGLVATALSAGLVWYFFIPPQLSSGIENPMALVSIGIFMIMGILFSLFHDRLRKANQQTTEALKANQQTLTACQKLDAFAYAERAQQEVIASEQRYRGLFEHMNEGFAYCQMLFENGRPTDFIYLEVNDKFTLQTGLKEVTGKRVSEIIPGIRENDPELFEIYGRVAATGKAEKFERFVVSLNLWFDISAYGTEQDYFVAVFDVITERKQAEAELRWKTAFLEAQVDATLDGILVVDAHGKKILQNRRMNELWKIPPPIAENKDDAAQMQFAANQTKNPRLFVEKIAYLNLHPDETSRDEIELMDGTVLDRYSSPVCGKSGQYYGRIWAFRDITVRKAHEREIVRLSRLYSALSQINQAIVWTPGRVELFEKICRALVECGKFTMAWIGQPDAAMQRVNPVAHWGDHSDYLSQVTVYADDRPEGRGPTGTAIREGKNYVCNDFAHDANIVPWHELANRAGLRAAAAFPIRQGGTIMGALTVYSDETGFFQDKEIALLEEAAGDVSYALDNLTREAARQRAEAALRASEEKFSSMFHVSPVPVTLSTIQDGRYLDVNPEFLKMFGWTRDEVIGHTAFELNIWVNLEDRAAVVSTVEAHGSVRNLELDVRTKSGQIRRILWSVQPVVIGDERCLLETSLDITERKRAEREIQRQAAFAEFNPNPVLELSATGEILYYNAAALQMANTFGQENPAQILPPNAAAIVRDCLAKNQPNLRLEINAGNRTISWSFFPVTQNSVVHCYAGDITERKRANEVNVRLATAVEQAAETIVITDTSGTILYANPAFEKTTGYTRAEALGQNPRILKSGKHDAGFYRQMWDVLNRGEVWHGHFINQRKDGKHYEEEATLSPVRNTAGKVVNYVAVKRDVTNEVQLDAQFRQSQKMEAIGQLAGGVAHDFNNLLAIIQLQVSLLTTSGELSFEQSQNITDIGITVDRAAALTRQLLLFSRRETLQPREMDLNESLVNLAKMLMRILGETISLQLNPAAQPMFIHADVGMMDQVLMNLAVNARDAMLKGGRLVIETSGVEFDEFAASQSTQARPGSFVCLSVSDTGCGIPPEILPRIFEPFFTTKAVGKGTGLGLATVFGIVQRHQGWINVSSEVGHGTTFKVYLPRLAGMSAKKIAEKMLATNPTGNETILLVEDEAPLRVLVRKLLTRQGYRILEAPTGVKALEVWQEHREEISLLLTDLIMPGDMTGNDLAELLLKDDPKLKVIYMSGYSDETAGKDMTLQEGVTFLPKPVEPHELLQTVRQKLDQPNVPQLGTAQETSGLTKIPGETKPVGSGS